MTEREQLKLWTVYDRPKIFFSLQWSCLRGWNGRADRRRGVFLPKHGLTGKERTSGPRCEPRCMIAQAARSSYRLGLHSELSSLSISALASAVAFSMA